MPKKKTTKRSAATRTLKKPSAIHIRVFKVIAIGAALVTAYIGGTLVQKQANAESLLSPHITSFSVAPTTVTVGTQANLAWHVDGPLLNGLRLPVGCEKSGDWQGPAGVDGNGNGGDGFIPTAARNYTLTLDCYTILNGVLNRTLKDSQTVTLTATNPTPPPSGGGGTSGGGSGGGSTTSGGSTSGSGTTSGGSGTTGNGTTGTGSDQTGGTSTGGSGETKNAGDTKKLSTTNNKNGMSDKNLGFWDLFWKYWYWWLFWLLLLLLIIGLIAYILRSYGIIGGKKKKSDDKKSKNSSAKK